MSTIESFSILLASSDQVLQQASTDLKGFDAVEAKIRAELTDCRQLVRWAFIRTESGNHLRCEGAYLRQA